MYKSKEDQYAWYRAWSKRPEVRARARQLYKDDPELRRRYKHYHLKRFYDITIDEYDALCLEQNNCCAVCGTHQSKLKKPLYVDHNHDTGKVRGLLCDLCNRGLGYFKDDVNRLIKAIDYITEDRNG